MTNFRNVFDYETEARQKLPTPAFDYYAGGAVDEWTIDENRAAFRRVRLSSRVLRGAPEPELATTLLGQAISMPVIIAPVAFQAMAHPRGEVATARAAGQAGTIMILSTTSNAPVRAVVDASKSGVWFQLYMFKDRAINTALVREAEKAGCKAIVLTVDVPAWGRRERDLRNRFSLPAGLVIESLLIPEREDFYDGRDQSDLSSFINERFKFDLTWDDVASLKSLTKLPVVLKGIMHARDAELAVEHGVTAIIVSNHGGRQFDAGPATLDALPAIVSATDGRIPVLLDGGIRRGTDVLKALALGASAVAVGRPVVWGLAVNGEDGVREILELYRSEIRNAMILCGCAGVRDATPEIVWRTS